MLLGLVSNHLSFYLAGIVDNGVGQNDAAVSNLNAGLEDEMKIKDIMHSV